MVDYDTLEHLINKVRQARAAEASLSAPERLVDGGGIATFPVSVLAAGTGSGARTHWWSFDIDHEPGAAYPVGITEVRYQGVVGRCRFSGRFHVTVGDPPAGGTPPASFVTSGDRPAWSAQLPANVAADLRSPLALRRALVRSSRRGMSATESVMTMALPYVDQLADDFALQLQHRQSTIDRQDVVSVGWKRAYQVLEQFAGPGRPQVPWSTALYRNCRRDMSRAVHGLDGASEATAIIRSAWAAHPEISEPEAMGRELAIQSAERRLAARHPGLDPVELRRRAEVDARPCRYSLAQIEAARTMPTVVSLHDRTGRHDGIGAGDDDGTREEGLDGVDDAGLLAVEEPIGPVVSRLAELGAGVGEGALIDLATDLGIGSGGDPCAADLGEVRRRLLAPFLLPDERPSRAALDAAGRRARRRLVAHGRLIEGRRLAEAWRSGPSAAEA